MTYSGICIGGPLDGQQLEHHAKVFLVHTRPPARPLKMGQIPNMVVHQTHYDHTEIEGVGVWVRDPQTPGQVIKRLLAVYMAAVKEDREDD